MLGKNSCFLCIRLCFWCEKVEQLLTSKTLDISHFMCCHDYFPKQFVHAVWKSEGQGVWWVSMPQLTCHFGGRDRGLWEAWDLGASLTDSTELDVCPLVKAERLSGVGRNSACKHSQCLCTSCLLVMETQSQSWPAVLLVFQRVGITIQCHE